MLYITSLRVRLCNVISMEAEVLTSQHSIFGCSVQQDSTENPYFYGIFLCQERKAMSDPPPQTSTSAEDETVFLFRGVKQTSDKELKFSHNSKNK